MRSPTFTSYCINLSKIYNWFNYLYHTQPLITFHWLGRLLYVMFWGCWRGCRGVCFTLWLFTLTPWTVTQFWNKVQQNQHTIALISFCTDFRSYRCIWLLSSSWSPLFLFFWGWWWKNSSLRYSLSMLNLLNIPWEEIGTIIICLICNLTHNSFTMCRYVHIIFPCQISHAYYQLFFSYCY